MPYDLDLIEACKKAGLPINVCHSPKHYLEIINQTYPALGSRIDLSSLPHYKYARATPEHIQRDYCNFVKSLPDLEDDDSEIIYIGDSLTDHAYVVKSADLHAFLCVIVDIPQSHYLFRSDFSWCINLSFENDMEFARLGAWQNSMLNAAKPEDDRDTTQ